MNGVNHLTYLSARNWVSISKSSNSSLKSWINYIPVDEQTRHLLYFAVNLAFSFSLETLYLSICVNFIQFCINLYQGVNSVMTTKLDNTICLHPLHPWTWISHILYWDEFLFLGPLSSDHICSITSMESALPLALLLEMLDFLSKKQMNL